MDAYYIDTCCFKLEAKNVTFHAEIALAQRSAISLPSTGRLVYI